MTVGGGSALDRAAPVPHIVNQTKLAIVAVMLELDRPVSSIELQVIWAEPKELSIFDYHLSTLVSAGVAEIVVDRPELRFRMSGRSRRVKQQDIYDVGSQGRRFRRS